jgi:hypothetical protein
MDFLQFGLALDGEQGGCRAAACPAFESSAIKRRPIVLRGLQQSKGHSALMAVWAKCQERQAAAAAGD